MPTEKTQKKIHILFKFKNGPWGGGNQFLKALKKELQNKGVYTENPNEADIILFNSYPFGSEYLFNELYKLKKSNPEKIIIYRVDGPISLIRNKDVTIDKIISLFNRIFVDGIIFQSKWSAQNNQRLFKIHSTNEVTIYNAPDNSIFNRVNKKAFDSSNKIRIIATSWSGGKNKGFDIYKFIDENLNFNRYDFIFVGNVPPKFKFKNAQHVTPLPSEQLAEELKKSDIYITASKNDPCSNSLIEALSCGLPAIALNDGGHPELIQKGGMVFNTKEEIIPMIEKIVQDYNIYQGNIPNYTIDFSANKYIKFAKRIYSNPTYSPRKITYSKKILFAYLKFSIAKWKFLNILAFLKNSLWKK